MKWTGDAHNVRKNHSLNLGGNRGLHEHKVFEIVNTAQLTHLQRQNVALQTLHKDRVSAPSMRATGRDARPGQRLDNGLCAARKHGDAEEIVPPPQVVSMIKRHEPSSNA
jgi:hypothetical protein